MRCCVVIKVTGSKHGPVITPVHFCELLPSRFYWIFLMHLPPKSKLMRLRRNLNYTNSSGVFGKAACHPGSRKTNIAVKDDVANQLKRSRVTACTPPSDTLFRVQHSNCVHSKNQFLALGYIVSGQCLTYCIIKSHQCWCDGFSSKITLWTYDAFLQR